MTPRKLDWRSIEPKLRKINELLDQLSAMGELDETRLRQTDLATLAAERILTLVVDLAFAVNSHVSTARLRTAPDNYRDSFRLAAKAGLITEDLAQALAPSAGLRNVLVHGYLDVDYAMVSASIPLAQVGYRDYVRQVARWLRDHADQEPLA